MYNNSLSNGKVTFVGSLALKGVTIMELWNDYGISNWVVVLVTSIILLCLYIDGKFRYWKRRGVKSQSLWDFLTTMRDIVTKSVQDSVLSNYRKFGRVYGSYMGLKPQLVIGDPALLKHILVKDFHTFRNRMRMKVYEPLFDNMLTLMEDEDWKRVRCIISPTFTSSRMRKMADLVRECAEKFSKYCKKIADRNDEVDCKKCFAGFMTDIIALTAFGTKVNALENPNHPFVQHARKLCSQDALSFFLILFLFPKLAKLFFTHSSVGRVFRYFKGFAQHVIEEREKNNIRANDFLQLMFDAQRGQLEQTEDVKKSEEQPMKLLPDHKTMSLDEMYAQCIVFFMGGNDATSSTLAFVSYYLALNPDCQERLIKEIDKAWESHGEINYDVLHKMTYLDAVVCEVLRLKPTVLLLMRTACEEYNLGDTRITVEKGTTVVVPVYAMHHDPEYFPEPERFDPERFMPHNRQSIPPYVYLPFGEGPRNCIGMRYVNMVLKLCVVYLLRTIRLEATEKTKKPLQYYRGQGLQPKAVIVRMRKRDDVKT